MAALLQECKEEEEEESASAGDSHRNCLASLSKWGLPLVIDHKTNDPTCHAIEDLRGLLLVGALLQEGTVRLVAHLYNAPPPLI